MSNNEILYEHFRAIYRAWALFHMVNLQLFTFRATHTEKKNNICSIVGDQNERWTQFRELFLKCALSRCSTLFVYSSQHLAASTFITFNSYAVIFVGNLQFNCIKVSICCCAGICCSGSRQTSMVFCLELFA